MKRIILLGAVALMLAGCGDDDAPPPNPTSTPVDTATPSPTVKPSSTATPTVTDTPTATGTVTSTRTITRTPSMTPTLGAGANIGYFGILRADNTVLDSSGSDAEGRPIFDRPTGSGFVIVVEAKRGTNSRNPGELSYNPDGPPDFQIESNRDLGDGSDIVCDNMGSMFGGVPGIDPPDFDDVPMIVDALNDFGCRFTNGSGAPIGRLPNDGCVLFADGEYGFVDPNAQIQFCGTVTRPMHFDAGDTILTARVLDTSGLAGPEQQIVVRVREP
jgi:hypothetical protein